MKTFFNVIRMIKFTLRAIYISFHKNVQNNIIHQAENPTNTLTLLIHGINEDSSCFKSFNKFLLKNGHDTLLIDYDSTHQTILESSKQIANTLRRFNLKSYDQVNIIAHSMGGIVSYYLLQNHNVSIDKIIMIASPLKGSLVADYYCESKIFKKIFLALYGPAAPELRTSSPVIKSIGKINNTLGLIKGNRKEIIFFNKIPLKKHNHDGIVALEEVENDGALDSVIIKDGHLNILFNQETFRQALYFLKNNKFN